LEAVSQNPSELESPGEIPDAASTLDPFQPRKRRRRRLKRTAVRLFIDGLIPFAVLIGMVVMAAGIVGVVEHDAASASNTNNRRAVRPLIPMPPASLRANLDRRDQNLELIQNGHNVSRPDSVAANLADQLQETIKAELGFEPPADREKTVTMDDVMDWGLIEESEMLRERLASKSR
jgi:hypothetical protein